MICRLSTTGMSGHPTATALARDALGSTNRAEQASFCACKALTAGHEEAQVFGRVWCEAPLSARDEM